MGSLSSWNINDQNNISSLTVLVSVAWYLDSVFAAAAMPRLGISSTDRYAINRPNSFNLSNK
jgi:hypothetical protein